MEERVHRVALLFETVFPTKNRDAEEITKEIIKQYLDYKTPIDFLCKLHLACNGQHYEPNTCAATCMYSSAHTDWLYELARTKLLDDKLRKDDTVIDNLIQKYLVLQKNALSRGLPRVTTLDFSSSK
jgi:hypothetical protein